MQGISLPAVSLPLGSAWQQQWPRLVLYLSVFSTPPSLAAPQVSEVFLNRSFTAAGSVATCQACPLWVLLAGLLGGWRQPGCARLRRGFGGLGWGD